METAILDKNNDNKLKILGRHESQSSDASEWLIMEASVNFDIFYPATKTDQTKIVIVFI